MKKLLVVAVIFAVMSQAALAINTRGGIQVKCPVGQRIYVGSNGHVSCIKSGSLGVSNPGGGGEVDPSGHGCAIDGGFNWCPSLNKCVQPWMTSCPGGVYN